MLYKQRLRHIFYHIFTLEYLSDLMLLLAFESLLVYQYIVVVVILGVTVIVFCRREKLIIQLSLYLDFPFQSYTESMCSSSSICFCTFISIVILLRHIYIYMYLSERKKNTSNIFFFGKCDLSSMKCRMDPQYLAR